MIKFEKVSRFADVDIAMPERKTANSAGYDFVVAQDTLLMPYPRMIAAFNDPNEAAGIDYSPKELSEVADITKHFGRPTLVSTGMKCHLEPDTYLELSVRSSSPLKYWTILANGVGIIDADYCNNPDNEGEIFFQLINLLPFPIKLHKGDVIGQGIIKHYLTTDDDAATGARTGGFGSTSSPKEMMTLMEEALNA